MLCGKILIVRTCADFPGQRRMPGKVADFWRWRLRDLAQWIWEEFGISLDETTVGRELKALGFVKISVRPRHLGQNEFAIEDFKKTFPPIWQKSGPYSRSIPR